MSAEERRRSVVRAAISEFARGGYASTSTAAIAQRVGVSQPYLFRLFPDKRAIFLAAARSCTALLRERFDEVSHGLSAEEAHDAMAAAYKDLVADREWLLFQMQMYVAAATAEQDGDAEFAAEVREVWASLWDLVERRLGSGEAAADFISRGMLINVLLGLGFPPEHRFWACCLGTGADQDNDSKPSSG
jgi:AcrR family transcriptional regulator